MNHSPKAIAAAYEHCMQIARNHYENFPVASVLVPKPMRQPIAAIYAFARTADDFADEGGLAPEIRLANLDGYVKKLDRLITAQSEDDLTFIALGDAVRRHELPIQLLYDLLSAFRMDVTKTRFANWDEVLMYCSYSANPIGRLLLHLYKQTTPQQLAWSDAICSALQVINFLQDIAQDYIENQRIYMPLDEMARFGVDEAHFKNQISDLAMRRFIDFQIDRATALLAYGLPLAQGLSGRLGLELRLTAQGGFAVLAALKRQENVFARPRLRRVDWLGIAWRALLRR